MGKCLEGNLSYEEWLKSLGLLSLEESEGRPHCIFNFMSRSGGAGTNLVTLVSNDRTQRNSIKLEQAPQESGHCTKPV